MCPTRWWRSRTTLPETNNVYMPVRSARPGIRGPAFEDARRRDYMPRLSDTVLLGVGAGAESRSPLPSGQSGHGSHRRCWARSFSGAHLRSREQPRPGEEIAHAAHTLPIVLPSGSLCACSAKRRVLPVRIRTLWRRLWEVPDVVRSPNAECPLCGAGVVVEPNVYGGVTLGCGSVLSPRPRQELIAVCAKHGRSPYNDKTVKYTAEAATATGAAGRVAPN